MTPTVLENIVCRFVNRNPIKLKELALTKSINIFQIRHVSRLIKTNRPVFFISRVLKID